MRHTLQHVVLHLRFPFSLFLLPVFLFGLSFAPEIRWTETTVLFVVLHLLVYPSSNGYNSYMDQDEGSIGGIKHPPKVPGIMFLVSVILDALSLIGSWILLGIPITLLLGGYILASRAYSYRGIRLKRYALPGFLTVAFFQGPVVYAMTTFAAVGSFNWTPQQLSGLGISFLLIGAGYPLTQIYQHEQDRKDGVITLSMLLGLTGTFVFSGILFSLLGVLLGVHIWMYGQHVGLLILMAGCLAPVGWLFTRWMRATLRDTSSANFENTMQMNLWGSISLNGLFALLFIYNILQLA